MSISETWLFQAFLPPMDARWRSSPRGFHGLPLARGVPLGVDATMISPLHCDGKPWARADVVPGVSFLRAAESKASTYPELVDSDVVKLTTLACEVGGR